MSQGGRHTHTIRRLTQRLDAVLQEERERQRPPPPPVSEEHRALRKCVEEACAEIEIDAATYHLPGGPLPTPKGVRSAIRALDLLYQERDLLTRSGVDGDVYLPD
jgi:hypothetical protein